MLTPNGLHANKIDRVMLLALWATTLAEEEQQSRVIFAGVGKPTYPINVQTIRSFLGYWQKLENLAENERFDIDNTDGEHAIDYGDPRGDKGPRELMAQTMSAWYEADISPDNVLFTVGGIGALRIMFETLNTHYEEFPGYRIITPFPHYSAYASNELHRLHPIHVMKEKGYHINAQALEDSIQEALFLAEDDHGWPKAVLFCNPSNPLGTMIPEEELAKIAEVLRRYPDLFIIFDEAYTEMSFVKIPSFLKIAPDLKKRIMIMRSATKALSAAGERMAVILVFDEFVMNEMLNKNINYFLHAPRSAQLAYAETMAHFDEKEREALVLFYKKKVDYVLMRLKEMGAEMPDPDYQVEATFYALGDFSDLFGLDLPEQAARALQRTGKVKSGEELAYYLLFEDKIMIAPLSYYGLEKDCTYMRITCSASERDLKELMDRLEQRLFSARKKKYQHLLENIDSNLEAVRHIELHLYETIRNKINVLSNQAETCLLLKAKNQSLNKIQSIINNLLDIES
ncbi:aspartate aminotransferase A [Legionella quinlivanii]|uniref:Aminotransferase n=1 Tax=Legionella quinlivanii TaxID=45073 RepID=A0A0W0Y8Y9_9GAMM|nr:pyridoxal phosphate-dependent aminotransferase [Legionella quinlivanii]KTD53062.1 aspartate aminotransferase A [Legionella quinlivanii]MCW8451360.1 pyridoxal phosphate-dependent aminotransferase [Legionella quinlivanii]SEG16550.1 aminotransferase [Legionella quinlivanii DSM 21216]STY10442.1 kynurenine--oxoglutarate transaminase [Legionella quinlivanii]